MLLLCHVEVRVLGCHKGISGLYITDSSIMKPNHAGNVSDTCVGTRIMCIFKNLSRVSVSCTCNIVGVNSDQRLAPNVKSYQLLNFLCHVEV